MGIFSKKDGGFMDEIRCDEPSYLIWKWHPAGSQKGANRRESAIRWGSSLRVRDGSVAAFVYHQKDGTYQDFIEGPYDQIIKTANLPVLASIVGLAYDGGHALPGGGLLHQPRSGRAGPLRRAVLRRLRPALPRLRRARRGARNHHLRHQVTTASSSSSTDSTSSTSTPSRRRSATPSRAT